MKITFADLWRPAGTIERGTYALVGALGFALKHNLERLLATMVFSRPWGVFNYWEPIRNVGRITNLSRADGEFLAAMVALAMPFIWVGVVLTQKRLRSAQLPSYLLLFFFVPFLNLLFFLVLCILPERDGSMRPEPSHGSSLLFARIVPDSTWGSAAAASLITAPIGLALMLLGTKVLVNYGWGMFVALPFAMGFTSALIYGVRQPRTLNGCINVACLSVTLLGAAMLAFAWEGVICLIMAAPIWVGLAALGGVLGYWAHRWRWVQSESPAVLSVILLLVPGVQWSEHLAAVSPPVFIVHSAIEVNAPPETVWKQVIAFTEIPPPREWMFRAGIAYPIRAEMIGSGPGAERHCVFSTGAFVEPIEVWDEPHELKFSVTSNPAPMQEWTPYPHVDPPHLHGFMISKGGQFRLTALPNGRTRLEGTTWYQHGLWPAAYWRLWSDAIIHRIHMRVLTHIKDEAERIAS